MRWGRERSRDLEDKGKGHEKAEPDMLDILGGKETSFARLGPSSFRYIAVEGDEAEKAGCMIQ